MSNRRSKDKKRFGGWLPVALVDRAVAFAAARRKTSTDVLSEALTEYLDKHAAETTGEKS